MISYIFASSQNEKTDFIYKEIEQRTKNGENSYILVPEQYSMFSEKELLRRLDFSAQKYVQVLTFSRLSNIILSAMGPLRLKYIDSAGKNMLSQRALQLLSSKLLYFTKGFGQKGFASTLVKIFSEFKRYGITCDALENAAKECSDAELSAKLDDLKLLYEKYDELLNENNSDAEDNLSLVVPQIKKFDGICGKFFVNHFKSFTPVEYEALFALMQKNDFAFAFFSDKSQIDNGIFKSTKMTYKTLCGFAQKNGIKSQPPIYLDGEEPHKSSELRFLKQNFLNPRPQKYSSETKNIKLFRPSSFYGEVNCIADFITRLTRDEGYKFEDFLILTAQPEAYEDIIPVVFEKYGINYFMDTKSALAAKPFARFFSTLLEIAAYGFSYERIMICLKSGFLPINSFEIDIFENYLLAAGLCDRHYQNEKPFEYNPDKKLFNMQKINEIKEKALNPMIKLTSIKGKKSVKKINSVLLEGLSQNRIKERYQKRADLLLKQGDTESAREIESVWNTIMTVLAQAEALFGDTPVSTKKYYEIFTSAISDIKLGGVPPLLNQVIISATENFRSTDAKIVIVPGCAEGAFPKSFSEEGLLSDKERDSLSQSGFILAPGAFEKQWDEQLLVYSVLSAPSDMLVLSAPVSGNDGGELLCSDVFLDIKNIFPLLKEERFDENSVFNLPESANGAFDRLLIMLCRAKGKSNLLPPLWQTVYFEFKKIPEFSKKIDDLNLNLRFEETREKIDKKTAKLLYGDPLLMSVSKLEKYNACAFSYFLTYGLLLNERKKADFKASDIGTVLHDILAVYFYERKKENTDYKKLGKNDVKKEIEGIINKNPDLTSSVIYETSSYYRYMLLKIKDIATATAWKIVKFYAQSSFRPYGFEIKIDTNGTFPPYTINLEEGEAKIRGFIDRMDVYEKDEKKYFNIVDYKSSDKKNDPQLAKLGVRFQPLLYAGIVKENLKNSQPAAMMYMTMEDPTAEFFEKPTSEELEKKLLNGIALNGITTDDKDILKMLDADYEKKDAVHFTPTARGCAHSPEELDQMITEALETAKKATQKISDGDIQINPVVEKSKFDACQYCKFSSCCKSKY